jgi:hypothetical protein
MKIPEWECRIRAFSEAIRIYPHLFKMHGGIDNTDKALKSASVLEFDLQLFSVGVNSPHSNKYSRHIE